MNKYRLIPFLLFSIMHASGQLNNKDGYDNEYNEASPDTLEWTLPALPEEYYQYKKTNNGKENNSEQNKNSAVNRVLNTSFVVGTIEGYADVTETGAATYQIPILVPQGVAGFEPTVSIQYNSQTGNGLLGYGWNLAATSAISRTGKTFYYDNAAEAPQISGSDNIMLDGKRLILISNQSQNLTNGAKYRMEYDRSLDITYKTTGSYKSFVVKTKDGTTMEYGSTEDSNIQTSDGNTFIWLLTGLTDKMGNSINYFYDKNNNEFYLSKIQYAGNRSIQFTYETRNDYQNHYFAGMSIHVGKRLKNIQTYNGLTLIKKYEFRYNTEGLYSKLTEVTEKGQNNSQYNSTLISYEGEQIQASEYISTLSEQREGVTPLFGDFNGDGIMDFFSYPTKSSYTTNDEGTLFLGYKLYGDVSFYKKCAIKLQGTYDQFKYISMADLNGDGKMDLVGVTKAYNGTIRYNYYFFNGENLTMNGGFNTDGETAFVGDFDGDGKHDILIKENNKVFNGNGTQIASGGIDNWGIDYSEYYYPNSRYLCDFTGNGKTNILCIDNSNAWVYELNGNTFTKITSFNTSNIKNYYFPYFGDFNGDGKTDALIQNQYNLDDVYILYSTGNSFIKENVSNANIRSKVQVADFNNDGKADIFHMQIVNNNIRMKIGTLNGTNFNTTYHSTFLSINNFTPPDNNIIYEKFLFQVADFDGDGRAEFCNANFSDACVIHTFSDDNNLLVRSITNGLGATTSFDYHPITDNTYCSYTENNFLFPISGSAFPLYVTTNMTQSAGGYYDHMAYRYKNPRVHRQGKGFLGFGEIEAYSNTKDRRVTAKYNYNTSYYYPYMAEQKVTTLSGSNISTSLFENSFVYQGNKRITPYVKKQTDTDHLTGSTKTVECIQTDNWANPKKVIIKYGNDVTETITSDFFNSETENVWISGLPVTIEKKTTKAGVHWTEKKSYEYDSNYLVRKLTHHTNDGTKKVSVEIYAYNDVGNVRSKTVIPFSSSNELTTDYGYSPDNVFLTDVTDPLSFSTSSTYNTLGQLTTKEDHLNNNTTYEYDDMGRINKITYPDGSFTSTTFTWGGAVSNSIYCITESSSEGATVKKYFDGINRELRNSTKRFDGTEVHQDKKYNNAGKIYQESFPFKGTTASKWDTYSYDGYGRLSQLSSASGNIISYAYQGNSITETKDGMASRKTFNAKGELISVTDPAGEICYNLRPDGQPASVINMGIITSFEYDNYGRRVAINDPSAGRREFRFDDNGNLIEEKDADGRINTRSFDNYGRITSKVMPEFTTSYLYNDNGQLRLENSSNGTSRTWQYDTYGRLAIERDNGPDNKWLEKTYTYTDGNLSSIQFKSQSGSIGQESYHYSYGHLKEVRFDGVSVWKLNGENNLGIPTSASLGAITQTYSYNENSILTGRKSSSSGGGVFQHLTYHIEASTGNLKSRTDQTRNKQEIFGYDNLNRLTSYGNLTVDYDPTGIIMSKDDVSNSYSYCLANNFYGLSEVYDAKSTAIPPRNQAVTYTSFERPATISENNYQVLFTYDASGNRKKMQVNHNGTTKFQRYYLGNRYEADFGPSVNKQILYIGGDAYSAPAVYVNEGISWNFYYICRDHLGSMTHLTNQNGSVVQEYSYDAWGRLRDPATHEVYLPDYEPVLFLGRGYTGHEHLTMFGLINMNARLYDPATGSFLSPDPFVQAPDFTQNFNRYSYCMNNPLKYTDKNGEFWHIVIGAAIGGVSNWLANGARFSWKGLGYFGVGAAAGGWAGGAVSGAVSAGGFIGGSLSGAAGGAASGFVGGAGNTWMRGGNFSDGLKSGFLSAGIGGVSSGLIGGVTRGIIDYSNGYSFWNGRRIELVMISDYDKIANNYKSSSSSAFNDEILQDMIYDEFGVKVGDFNINKITTQAGKGVGLTENGTYYLKRSGIYAGGYLDYSSSGASELHIAPKYISDDLVAFRAIAGHELIHAYHHSLYGSNFNLLFSERVAYRYTHNTYFNNGRYMDAFNYYNIMLKKSYWVDYPANYHIPPFFKFY